MCRVNSDLLDDNRGNAGCVIRLDDQLLSIRHRTSGKLDIPGGTAQEGESAQCTAHRETWEETGFNVEVQQYLGSNQRGFHFYACQLDGNFDGKIQEFPVPDWAQYEVKGIQLVDPFVTQPQQWRFEDSLVPIRGMFNQTPES